MNMATNAQKPSFGISAVFVLLVVLMSIMIVGGVLAQTPEPDSAMTGETITQSEPATGSMTDLVYPMSPERKAKLIAYSQFRNIWRFVSFFLSLSIMALLLFTGFSARMRTWASMAGKKFFVVWAFLILYLIADYLLNFPFHVYRGFIVESNYGFMNMSFMEWWGEDLLNLLLVAVIGIIPMWFLYWLISRTKKWWLWFAVGSLPIMVFAIVIGPVVISPMFNDFQPLQDKALETELLTMADQAGIEGSHVFQVDASKQSSKINAYVTGLFGTKRIVLYDTMIKNFTTDEIKFVMGHEMGHYVMNHIWTGVLIAILFIALAMWLVSRTIQPVINRFKNRFGFDQLSDIASLPLLLIFLSLISFSFDPVTNGLSRYQEHRSDIYGMEISGVSGETAAISFDKLSVYNLSDPDPHPLIEFWFYSHPSLKSRMEFVRNYRP